MSDSDDWRVDQNPGGLSEREVLQRLTIEEKRQLAKPAILEFPHIDHHMLNEWLMDQDGEDDVAVSASIEEKTDALLDRCVESVESGDDPEALDRFIYGYLYEMNIGCTLDVNPDEVAGRDPLMIWKGAYDE